MQTGRAIFLRPVGLIRSLGRVLFFLSFRYDSVRPRAPGESVVTIWTLVHWALEDNFEETRELLLTEGLIRETSEWSPREDGEPNKADSSK